jgi:hypothetical protein
MTGKFAQSEGGTNRMLDRRAHSTQPPLRLADLLVIDARDAPAHAPVRRELP